MPKMHQLLMPKKMAEVRDAIYKKWKTTIDKFAEVRVRGRKRSMVG